MTMRATVQVNTQATSDPYGQTQPPVWAAKFADPIPCFVWTSSRKEQVNEQTTTTIVQIRMMIPRDIDVTERDRILMVQDRQGELLYPGPFNVRSVEWKKDHWELMLEGEAG